MKKVRITTLCLMPLMMLAAVGPAGCGLANVVPGSDIPDDYPHELLPIYEPSTVISAHTREIIDAERYIIIALVSRDEITEVRSFYEDLDHFAGGFDRRDGGFELSFEFDDGDEAFLTIGEGGDDMASYRDEGYKTHIHIRVVFHP